MKESRPYLIDDFSGFNDSWCDSERLSEVLALENEWANAKLFDLRSTRRKHQTLATSIGPQVMATLVLRIAGLEPTAEGLFIETRKFTQ